MKNLDKFPDAPGVYLIKNKKGKIIYIGKAKSLSKRIKSYFQKGEDFIKREFLIPNIQDIEFIVTRDEIESLILEANLIKKYIPKFNIRLRDDKSYPYLKITINEDYPKLLVTRKRFPDKSLYFGPYTHAKRMRKTLQIIKEMFPLRQCNKKIDKKKKRPCLNYHIKFCLAPCAGLIEKEEYQKIAFQAVKFLKGDAHRLIEDLKELMNQKARELNFEEAAKIRDKINNLETIIKHEDTVATKEDMDVINLSFNQRRACVVVLLVRNKRVSDERHFFLENLKYSHPESSRLLSIFLRQYYLESEDLPSEIILPSKVEEQEIIEEILKEKTKKKIKIWVAKRGSRENLLQLAYLNATNILEAKEKQGAIGQLRDYLNLNKLPYHIEGFDISNIKGESAVGSCVVYKEGKPSKKDYRRFKIKSVEGQDDFAMLGEIIKRRYKRLLEEKKDLPDLILVDGGKGQLNFAKKVLNELGIFNLEVIAISKEKERIGKKENIFIREEIKNIPPNSSALKLIRSIRDEAHRFAISYHKKLRSKEMLING